MMQGCFDMQHNLRDMVSTWLFPVTSLYSLFCFVGHLTWAYKMFSVLKIFLFRRSILMWGLWLYMPWDRNSRSQSTCRFKCQVREPVPNSDVYMFENLWDSVTLREFVASCLTIFLYVWLYRLVKVLSLLLRLIVLTWNFNYKLFIVLTLSERILLLKVV